MKVATCAVCGCTDADCSQCVARTGGPCAWWLANLCTACKGAQPDPALFGLDPAHIVQARWRPDQHAEFVVRSANMHGQEKGTHVVTWAVVPPTIEQANQRRRVGRAGDLG